MSQDKPVYIVSAARTPTGKRGGGLSSVHPVDLGVIVVKEVVRRAKIDPNLIDKIKMGCATQTAQQGFNIGRTIAASAFGPHMPASTVNMLCGSSAEAICDGWGQITSGQADIILAGGVENNHLVFQGQDLMPSSQTPGGILRNTWRTLTRGSKIVRDTLPKDYFLHPMGKSGDAIAQKRKITREELDRFAYESQMKAAHAMFSGKFNEEIVPVQTQKGIVKADEGIRPNTSLKALANLKPAFGKNGLHTAGSSSQISAGAAAVLLASEDAIKKNNLKPIAKLIASALVATDAQIEEEQLIGPIEAIRKVLKKANLTINDIDLFEINEAFASVVLATQKELNIPMEKINVNGGAIALGHPLGTSGARLPVTLIHEMQRRTKEGKLSKYGLEVLCIGGGQAVAIIFERV